MWKIALLAAGCAIVATGAIAAPSDNLAPFAANACAQTTTAAYRACLNDVEDAAWVMLGNCANISDPAERADCLAERDAAREEGRLLCSQQQDAREDVCDALGSAPYDPVVDPANFVSPEDASTHPNPYFPLVTNRHWVYSEGSRTVDVRVLPDTKVIQGVTCSVVHDVVTENGVPIEDTFDWYAQDRAGNVWYFGEIAVNYEDGQIIGVDGSWTGGVDFAKPGYIMKAAPRVGEVYRQEFSLANAEDLGAVTSTTGTESVPAASCSGDCVVTDDFTPIEPGIHVAKYYAPGIGFILSIAPDGTREELVQYEPGDASTPRSAGRAVFGLRMHDRSTMTRTDARLSYTLAAGGLVSADVLDAAGRVVRNVEKQMQGAGDHTLAWDGTDAGGRRVSRGIYFVRLTAGPEVVTHKVVLTQ